MTAEPMVADDVPGPGTVLGDRYRLRRLLGEGGMGRVFLADDERQGGAVAVKLLSDDRPIPKATQRFEREARAIARIDHANVVRVTDVGQAPRGGLYYVMEHLEGEELADTLEREGPLPWPRVRHIALQICGALQAAHEAGIVHRDLKLENCFRVTRGDDPDFVKILDFGVVKLLSPELDDGDRLTNTGATLGTPAYMAPELCRGKQVDHRVDVYALGVVLYELLTGSVPFAGDSFLDVALQHMNDPPPPLSDHVPPAELPDGLEAVVMRALAKAREDRFPTMAAFGRALERVGQPAEPLVAAPEPAALPITAPGGTVPALPVVAHAEDEGTRGRVTAWPWLAIGGAAALGLFAWWIAAGHGPPEPPAVEPVAAQVVDRSTAPEPPVEPTPPRDAGSGAEPADVAPSTSTGPAPSPAPAKPRLTDRQVDDALRRIQPRIGACAGKVTGGLRGDEVRVVLKVDLATGRVRDAVVTDPRDRFAVESCLSGVLRKLALPRVGGRGTQKIARAIVL